jgi:hypothetical protein
MNISCADRERIFLDGTAEEWAELERHASSCEACAAEVRDWKELSTAAQEMRDYSDDPALWPRIAESLAAEADEAAQKEEHKVAWPERLFAWRGWALTLGWQTALAGALVVALLAGGVSLFLYERHVRFIATAKSPFLNDRTLAEVERTENAYMQAIDKMAAEAKPAMAAESSPLMDSYREKLMVLDSAIGELRAQAGENPSNAHLRYQLLAMYREKQDTLREILESK